MATLAGGEDFSASPTGVTGTRLDNHVNNATISNVAQADMASSNGVIVRSASAPSDTDAGWWDTANNVFRIHNGTAWLPVATGALLTNKSGGQVIAGDVVVADTTTAESFKTSTTLGDTTVIGVAAETIAADASGVVLYGGIQDVLITGSATLGQFLRQSTTAKKAEATAAKGAGSFGLVLEAGTNTLIKALITGASVTVLDATAAETISGLWDFTGGLKLTNVSAPSTSADEVAVYAKDLSTRSWPYFREESSGAEIALGRIVQVVNTITGAVATGTTVIPFDDTIPQSGEGDQYMTLAITPTNSGNKLKIDVVVVGAGSVNSYNYAALFQDSTADALAAVATEIATGGDISTVKFTHYMSAGTTSATTFKVRAGSGAGTYTFNGVASGRIFGGIMASSITITEIAA